MSASKPLEALSGVVDHHIRSPCCLVGRSSQTSPRGLPQCGNTLLQVKVQKYWYQNVLKAPKVEGTHYVECPISQVFKCVKCI